MKHQHSLYSFLTLLIGSFVLFTSCGSKKDVVYFQDSYRISEELSKQPQIDFQVKIMPNDNLFIMVSAFNQQTVEPFNSANINRGSLNSTNMDMFGYLVDIEGNINLPLVGKVRLAGLTKTQAIELLQKEISVFVEDPVVNIRVLNFKINVIGEVNRPGVYTVTDERISIPQALSLAGDLTIYGNRRDVQLIRMSKDEKVFYFFDLTSPDIFLSPNYYLQQDDILYIPPNKTKAGSSTYNQYVPLTLSVTSVIITIISLIARNR